MNPPIVTNISPWLTVRNVEKAATFYKAAFGAAEIYRLESPEGGMVLKLSITDGAEFWLSDGAAASGPETLGGETIRMILTVADPDKIFAQALKAGALEIFAVGEGHGWRLGRIVDPFGLHWEIGHPIPNHDE